MDQVRDLAREHKPKLIWCGHSAYPRLLDFAAFAEIAEEVGAYLAADIAHIAGLIAGGAHPSPIPHADAVTTTTHKTLRGPRGGLILCKEAHAPAIDKAVFPGLQGGPHNHTIAAKAVAFREALQPSFKVYAAQIVANARALGEALLGRGYSLVTGGTDNHLLLIDLTPQGVGARKVARDLNRCGIELNANSVPFDTRNPFDPSGLRVGLASLTSRGLTEKDMTGVSEVMDDAIQGSIKADKKRIPSALAESISAKIREFLSAYPAPGL
jgi:glycine hydroxymethyltransferase